jgi:integrase
MTEQTLTSDNLHLSKLTKVAFADAKVCAVNCTSDLPDTPPSPADLAGAIGSKVTNFITNSIAPNTRRAYQSDLAHFENWGGSIPATPGVVASYLAAHADSLTVATLVRRVATISKAHQAKDLPNPCRAEIVRATLRGIKRTFGTAQHEAKPLLKEDLFRVLDAMGGGVKDVRDRALLLLGFAGGFRRSELVGLDCSDIEHVRQGLVINLLRSKVDQEGAGRKIGIPNGRTRHCPVAALDKWMELSKVEHGPVFRPVDRHGHIQAERLSGDAVSIIVKERVAAAGIDPGGFSGHSLRAGFATSAAQAGVSTLKIRAQTGHAADAMLARYVRDGELFVGNAAGALL